MEHPAENREWTCGESPIVLDSTYIHLNKQSTPIQRLANNGTIVVFAILGTKEYQSAMVGMNGDNGVS